MSDMKFEMLSKNEMQMKYNLYASNKPKIYIDSLKVPENLRPLIPLAELWGIGDDLIREDFVKNSTKEDLQVLKNAIEEYEDLLDEWLAGEESCNLNLTPEYLAFSNMRLAADLA